MKWAFEKLIRSQISLLRNISNKSLVENTLVKDCSLRCVSFDQIAELVSNANARKSILSRSEIESFAFSRNSSYSEDLKKLIDSSISVCLISNCSLESLDLIKHSSLCSFNSCFIKSGAKNSVLIDENKYAAVENGFIIENNELTSNINFILDCYKYSFFSLGESFESNFSLTSGETSLSNCLNLSFFALLPKSTDHLINSCSSLELNFSINCCLLSNSCFANSEKLIHKNLDNLDLSSSSIAKVIDAIYISPLDFNSSNFSSSLIFLVITPRTTSAGFSSGNVSLNLASNSSGTDTVILGILIPFNIYVNSSNYFNTYKSFESYWLERVQKYEPEILERMRERGYLIGI